MPSKPIYTIAQIALTKSPEECARLYEDLISKAIDRNHSTRASAKADLGYVESHHIIPRSLGGPDESSNLVYLTPEEHYNAHIILYRMFPGVPALFNAVWQMSTKNKNKTNGGAFDPDAESYAILRKEFARRRSIAQKDIVAAIHKPTGTRVKIPKEEFRASDEYAGQTLGTVVCKDSNGNVLTVSKEEFRNNPNLVGISKGYAPYKDSEGNTVILHKTDCKDGYTHSTKNMVIVRDSENSIVKITLDEFYANPTKYTAMMTGMLNVYSFETKTTCRILESEYDHTKYAHAISVKRMPDGTYVARNMLTLETQSGERKTFFSLNDAAEYYGVTRRRLVNNMRKNFSAVAMLVSHEKMVKFD